MGYQDLSKKSVDNFVKDNKKYDVKCQQALINLKKKLHDIEICFNDKDTLLSIKNLIITFYSILDEVPVQHLRNFLEYFESWRQKNKSADNVGEMNILMYAWLISQEIYSREQTKKLLLRQERK